MTEQQLVQQVRQFCDRIAQDRLLVQAAGGNVSWKTADELWIKASGTWLADALHKDIFVPVSRATLRAAVNHGDFSSMPRALEGYTLRPSIETFLHALMPQRIVVHLHPAHVVAWLIRKHSEEALTRHLDTTLNWAFVDYFKPGADLARAVHDRARSKSYPELILLGNHGVIIGGDTVEDIEHLLQALVRKLDQTTRPPMPAHDDLLTAVPEGYKVSSEELNLLAIDPVNYRRLENSWAICPDHVVFLGPEACRIDDVARLTALQPDHESRPSFIFVKDRGVLQNEQATKAQLAQLMFYADVMARVPEGQELQTLSHQQIGELLNWDAEKYRQQLNR